MQADNPAELSSSEPSQDAEDIGPGPTPAISIEDISKVFRLGARNAGTFKEMLLRRKQESSDNFTALEGITFDVQKGETFGLMGHNGSGKSTLLKLVSGIMRPTSGRIQVEGRLAALLELGAGFHPDLTGRENVFLNGSVLGLEREYVENTFDDIVNFAELEDFIDTPVRHYSSGMRARLGFSVATHLDPDVLLVDEILSVGDETFQQKCLERVHGFRSSGRTMLLVNHSAERIRQLCSRAAVLDSGRLIFVGTADDAIIAYREALADRRRDPTPHAPPPGAPAKAPNRPRHGAEASPEAEERPAAIVVLGALVGSEDAEETFDPLSDIGVVATVEVRESVPFRVRIVVRNQEGMVLFNRASQGLLGGPIKVPTGRHRVIFTLKKVPLRDGTYVVDVIAESPDGKQLHDRHGQAGTFIIKGSPIGLGLVIMGAACSVSPADEEFEVPTQPPPRKRGALL